MKSTHLRGAQSNAGEFGSAMVETHLAIENGGRDARPFSKVRRTFSDND
jgi:hypothetical protein